MGQITYKETNSVIWSRNISPLMNDECSSHVSDDAWYAEGFWVSKLRSPVGICNWALPNDGASGNVGLSTILKTGRSRV
jgi:hypothetical protein